MQTLCRMGTFSRGCTCSPPSIVLPWQQQADILGVTHHKPTTTKPIQLRP